MNPRPFLVQRLGLLAAVLCPAIALAQAPAALSERDYFEELPVVLSVSRLAQPLDETPGAVTIIDRDIIRRSGAREVADVLRLVPGFLVGGYNGANPLALYHGALDSFGTRLQVFVDGRSIYSTYYIGDTHRGLMGVVLEDIERIEVLRGSNSAAYGANAFLGVVNIVTRNAADTRGGMVAVTGGERGTWDNVARIGWGDDGASFRISASRRSDDGLERVYDDKHVSQAHFRADLRPTASDEVMFGAGGIHYSWGDGERASVGNPERTVFRRDFYLHGQWRHLLAADEEFRLSAGYDHEYDRDRTPYTPIPTVWLDYSGYAKRYQVEAQHSFVAGSSLRAVWGGGLRREEVWSPPLYYTQQTHSAQQLRFFGNLEWKPHARWVINAGGMWERHSIVGSTLSPRLMVNFHAVRGHTLRAGVTKASRDPSLYELRGDTRYFDANGVLRGWTVAASGGVRSEHLLAREIGYLGELRSWRLTIDLRGFREVMDDRVKARTVAGKRDYVNIVGPIMRGYEYQIKWRPAAGTQVWLSELHTRTIGRYQQDIEVDELSAPHRTTSLALFQVLPHGLDFALIYSEVGSMTWRGTGGDILGRQRRLDVRLAQAFKLGATRGELAWTTQAATGGYSQYIPSYRFERRSFVTLRLEY